jgi:branched-chain amino acid transport system permease protein
VGLSNWDFVGGTSGIKDIPGIAIGGFAFDVRAYAIFAWFLVACAIWFASNLVRSSFGRVLVAIAAGELGAQTLGVSGTRMKRQIFVVSAALAGIAGAVYASYVTYIDPSSFGFLLSVQLVLMSVIGGLRTLWGAIVGAAVVVTLSQVLQLAIPAVIEQVQKVAPWFPSAHGDFESFFFGAGLIAMLILVPRGIMGKREAVRA